MKDTKRLNDVLDMDMDLSDIEARVADDWAECSTPVLCVFKGQVPSWTMHDVILHNFLRGTILGFVMTEKINPESGLKGEINMAEKVTDPADLQGMPETAGLCASCDKSVACLGARCAITRANSEIDALADDDDLDIHFHGPDSVVTDMLSTCDDCEDAGPDSCDTCNLVDPDIATRDTADGDEFDKLKLGHWDILCRWIVAAADCHAQRDFKDDLDKLCRISGDCCEFADCPRINDHHAY
jgi:hypothetical protein